MLDLVLLRHGQSTWNAKNLFTGWVDVELTEAGEAEAQAGGTLLAEEPGLDLRVLHTSLLTRAIRTAELALAAAGRSWLPVQRDWRLNERHYGDLQGKNKADVMAEFGKDQLLLWRRSYSTPPPPLRAASHSRAATSRGAGRACPTNTGQGSAPGSQGTPADGPSAATVISSPVLTAMLTAHSLASQRDDMDDQAPGRTMWVGPAEHWGIRWCRLPAW